ncbi:MAG TPA: glycoside hydrolase family 2 TIM barrel-domain containing protein [Verrucomicrobiae bacterium]|nr:glycoside hydrolase family 2 TIM barrel-domain containing protein [Verrucomicrobiae bacterium]
MAASIAPRQQILLDPDWLFHLGDCPTNAAAAPAFEDTGWQNVNIPHDYVLNGTYSRTNDEKHGYLPVEPAWYRKHFTIPASDQGRILRLDFDGVFRDSKVWLNGQFLGEHQSGYTPFSYDVTQIAKPGAKSVIAVRVDPRQFEGHWYEGGGIYRHVRLTVLSPLHVAQYGAYVISTLTEPGGQFARGAANLTIQTTVQNEQPHPAHCRILSEIFAPHGRLVASIKTDATMPANGQKEIEQQTTIHNPQLWSLESPNLYQLRTTIQQSRDREGAALDLTTTTFGIRTIRYDPDNGFFLNGQHVEIYGTANHQDFAGVGIAVPDSLQSWRVKQLKAMGCNAWRTAHNPPSDALLDACDRLGMMVMDENRHLGDSYLGHSPHGTTATNLGDLATMILRDRNHPGIIMWSMCNEEGLRLRPEGKRLFAAMKRVVHLYDNTRPITCAINSDALTNGITDEDIIGVNYRYRDYDKIHQAAPHLAMFGSEANNQKTTRGEYAGDKATGMCSSYSLSDKTWLEQADRPFICGSFTWTGFDYKGEPNPYGWPDVANHTGLMDSCGFPKDKYYYFESCWSPKPMVHIVPATWNWPGQEGQNIRVLAFSNAKQVELFLNGKSLGRKDMPHGDYAEWEVPYQPGQLMAKAYGQSAVHSPQSGDGSQPVDDPPSEEEVVATNVVETTGAPARIELSPDRTTLQANAEDAVVVPVSILDARGRVVPDASNRVTFTLIGGEQSSRSASADGEILGVGNGNPADHDPDKGNQRNAFHGHCMAVIEAGTDPGTIQLIATSPGLDSSVVNFNVR